MNVQIKFCTLTLVVFGALSTLQAQTAATPAPAKVKPAAYAEMQKEWQEFTKTLPAKTTNAQNDALAQTYNELIERLEAMTERPASNAAKAKTAAAKKKDLAETAEVQLP